MAMALGANAQSGEGTDLRNRKSIVIDVLGDETNGKIKSRRRCAAITFNHFGNILKRGETFDADRPCIRPGTDARQV